MDVLFLNRETFQTFGSNNFCGQHNGKKHCFLHLLLLVSLEVEPGQDQYEAGFYFSSGTQRNQQTLGIPTAEVVILYILSWKHSLM